MSSINYCTLDEAWGKSNIHTPKNSNIHSQHKKEYENNNPLRTPNINYNCSPNCNNKTNSELSGFNETKHYTKYDNSKSENLIDKKYTKEFDDMNPENKELFSFITSLSLDESTKTILLKKISNAFDSIKYDTQEPIKEDFSQRYYNHSHFPENNRNIDLLFLILLGIFLIYILDKK